jgi:LysM repeat protein
MLGLLVFGQDMAIAQSSTAAPPPLPSTSAPPATKDVFVASAPNRYVVVRGDTLWGIAKRFLRNPLQWPQIWHMNRTQIKNPHWIYPGQVIVIDRTTGSMYLEGQGPGGTVRVEPEVRVETSEEAIPSIPQDVIEPFLSRPLVVDTKTMESSPRIISAKGDRVILARGDVAYVAGITDPNITSYQIYRPGTPLKDPETGNVMAYQAEYLGAAQVTRSGNPATVVITSFAEEIAAGDRLVPSAQPALINYVPHAPDRPVKGQLIGSLGHEGYAGRDMIVVLNRGADSGLEIGNVLAVQSAGREITDRTNGSAESFKLPDERNGLIFVFRVYDNIAYALVLDADIEMQAGDVFTQP